MQHKKSNNSGQSEVGSQATPKRSAKDRKQIYLKTCTGGGK